MQPEQRERGEEREQEQAEEEAAPGLGLGVGLGLGLGLRLGLRLGLGLDEEAALRECVRQREHAGAKVGAVQGKAQTCE